MEVPTCTSSLFPKFGGQIEDPQNPILVTSLNHFSPVKGETSEDRHNIIVDTHVEAIVQPSQDQNMDDSFLEIFDSFMELDDVMTLNNYQKEAKI